MSSRLSGAVHPTEQSVGIIGAGAAGLITAHVLIQDGFQRVELITKDASPGGVWTSHRVYPGLTINSVHGEYRFSSLPMPSPQNAKATGGRLTGQDMQAYMTSFADRFLRGKIKYHTEILNLRRVKTDPVNGSTSGQTYWEIDVKNNITGRTSTLWYDKIVLCSGGCNTPNIPSSLSTKSAGFRGPIIHSSEVGSRAEEIFAATELSSNDSHSSEVVIVGGGKSAQDVAAYMVNEGRKATVVFDTPDSFLAVPIPLPDFIRKSRFLSVISPHTVLRTRLERFLHTTWLGSKITHAIWSFLEWSSMLAFGVSSDSPLRRTHSMFWGVRTNDEGVGSPTSFYQLVKAGKVNIIAPNRASEFVREGVKLQDGTVLRANAVILSTGYESSWKGLMNEETQRELGLEKHSLSTSNKFDRDWDDYVSLSNPPVVNNESSLEVSTIYRGLVPAKNILNRDFAINGAVFTTNPGYAFEVCAHWISSYFLQDPFLKLPSSVEEAIEQSERNNTWLRKRYPLMVGTINESHSADLAFWSWPQATDTLLDDMGLAINRSGGNCFNWAFKVIGLKDIATLKKERDEKRGHSGLSTSTSKS
ncbi:FAD/NAD-P-binding domain-containing protein [Abortiporus biennis]|nr:FAD/NAD-P-binding domain-containing protein [Abortiporus biennis]